MRKGRRTVSLPNLNGKRNPALAAAIAAAVLIAGCGGGGEPTTAPVERQATVDTPDDLSPHPMLGCADAVQAPPIASKPGRDSIVGPFALYLARDNYLATLHGFSPGSAKQGTREIKILALLEPTQAVTVTIPARERSWLSLLYVEGTENASVRFHPCGAGQSRAFRNIGECKPSRAEPCSEAVSQYPGRFVLDFGKAPRHGECAELLVTVDHRLRVPMYPFAESPKGCSG